MEKNKRARGAAAKTKELEAPSNLRPITNIRDGVAVGVRVRVGITLDPWFVQAVRRYMEKSKRARGAAAKTKE